MEEQIYIVRYENGKVYQVLEKSEGQTFVTGTRIEDTLENAKSMLNFIGIDTTMISEFIINN